MLPDNGMPQEVRRQWERERQEQLVIATACCSKETEGMMELKKAGREHLVQGDWQQYRHLLLMLLSYSPVSCLRETLKAFQERTPRWLAVSPLLQAFICVGRL